MIIKRDTEDLNLGTSEKLSIQLTDEELEKAYFEQEHKFDCEAIKDEISTMSDSDFDEYDGNITKEIAESLIDDMAKTMREYINKSGLSYQLLATCRSGGLQLSGGKNDKMSPTFLEY